MGFFSSFIEVPLFPVESAVTVDVCGVSTCQQTAVFFVGTRFRWLVDSVGSSPAFLLFFVVIEGPVLLCQIWPTFLAEPSIQSISVADSLVFRFALEAHMGFAGFFDPSYIPTLSRKPLRRF